jgi:hypothetical protein
MLFELLLPGLLKFCGDKDLFCCVFPLRAEKTLLGVLSIFEYGVLAVSVKVSTPLGAVGCWLSFEAILMRVS